MTLVFSQSYHYCLLLPQYLLHYHYMNRQDEILTILSEEAAEVVQACCKVKRFGLDSNRVQLVQELGDFLALLDLLCQELDIDQADLQKAYQSKMEKLKIYSNLFTEN